jgi:hypothetical protein
LVSSGGDRGDHFLNVYSRDRPEFRKRIAIFLVGMVGMSELTKADFGPALIVDCEAGTVTEWELTPAEVAQRIADIEQAQADNAAREQKEADRQAAIARARLGTASQADLLLIMGIE